MQPEQPFCNHCGAKITIEPQMRAVPKKGISFSTPVKWTIISFLILAVGLVSAHLYLSNQYKPDKAVSHFEDAVNNKDYQAIRTILEQGGTESDL